ncbi:cytoplasmic polyadenylation element-binding protein 2-like isoform X2 [Ostrea edulis]|uniref:cytoplasmic polyadenylation element-binding protein 2-like isoform X2 n=1 Tax=Ostrea edulis TaxID=37623 RepID=UPI0024AF6523|nr:cytoplasmic polyadenylation element-binding protein 2-like isoform X2 [Ostrea edulis]
MGDYGVAVATNIRGFSSVNSKNVLQSKPFFPSDPRTMQDENIQEKSTSQLQQLTHVVAENGNVHGSEIRNKSDANSLSEEKKADLLTSVSSTLAHGNVMESISSTAVVSSMNSPSSLWTNQPPEEAVIPAYHSLNGTLTLSQFPAVHNNMYSAGIATHMGLNMAQQPPPAHRRAITGHHNFPARQQQPGILINNNSKGYPNWSNAPQWSQGQTWGGVHSTQHQRRSVPNFPSSLTAASFQMKKSPVSYQQQITNTAPLIAPSRFRRSTSFPGQMHQAAMIKPGLDMGSLDDTHRESMLSYQDRSNSYDSMRFSNFENQLLDIMRNSGDHADPLKVKPSFGFGDLDEEALDPSLAVLGCGPRGSPGSQGERIERFSRKVFVGGLPPDIDEEEITAAFRRFGALVVDWPHKAESKSYFPPKGYCFLLFQDEMSVQTLIEHCIVDDEKLYWCVSSPTMKDKPVQIRPWNLSDSDFVMDGSQPLDPRKTIFVGGVPRPLRAVELAMIMDRLYGGVCYAGIDTDPELKYPKGAGRVAFSNQQSYIAAISARFVQLQHGEIDKRVEVKPYVLDDQMCDECQGSRCGGKFAPFFCANVTCLQYYCEQCWAGIHSRPGREFHKPLVKEGADRPRAVPFRWC